MCQAQKLVIMAHLDLGFRRVSYLSQVLTGADVRIGPSCKYPFQLQQLANPDGDPLSLMETQPTGTGCWPGWESKQDSLQEPPPSLRAPLLPSSPFPSLLATLSHPTHPFPTRSPPGDGSTGLAVELEPEDHARAISHTRLRL